MPSRRMLLVFNPKSGHAMFAPNLYEVVDQFTRSGYEVTVYPTQSAGDARELILRRAGEFDCLVCAGGDGTLNEAVDALMLCKQRPVFGFIPAGTTNDFASSLGLPKDILKAAEVITGGVNRALDIGKFGDDYFSYVAAFGLFTDVSYATPQSAKNVLGHLAYLLEGVKRLGSVQSYRCTVDLGEEILEGEYIFGMVSNSLSVGGFQIPSETPIRMDDGIFEISLLQMPTSFIDLQNIIASLLNQERYTKSLIIRQAGRVTITTEESLAWTLDGEYGGEFSRVEISNCHKAIEIMMPPPPALLE